MHGQKKRRKRSLEGTASFDGVSLIWELVSEPQWSNSGHGFKGLCISVCVADEARRELMIEYPYPTDRQGRPLPVPQRPAVSQSMIESAICDAIAAGWDPASRGKVFVFRPD